MSQVKMYKGVDFRDGSVSMIAVRDDEICISFFHGIADPWMTPQGFGNFDGWCPDEIEPVDAQSISEAELIWTA